MMMSYVVEWAVPGRAGCPLTPRPPPGMPLLTPVGILLPREEGGRDAGRVGATEASEAAEAAEEGGRITRPLEAWT